MNLELNRLRTFYRFTHLTPRNKYDFAKKGLYYNSEQNEQEILFNCVFCEEVFNPDTVQIEEILTHCCVIGDSGIENIPVCSPFDGDVNDKTVQCNLNYEEFRIATFSQWPHKSISNIYDLTKAGFYFTEVYDRITCYYCRFSLCKWKAGADPLKAHDVFHPTCKTMKEKKENEVNAFQRGLMNNEIIEQEEVLNASARENVVVIPKTENNATKIDIASSIKIDQDVDVTYVESSPDKITKMEDFIKSNIYTQLISMDFGKVTIITVARNHLDSGKNITDINDLITSVLDYKNHNDSILTELNTIKEKYQILKDEKECKICFANSISVLFNPCRHMLTCNVCSKKVENCPVCQQRISAKIDILFP